MQKLSGGSCTASAGSRSASVNCSQSATEKPSTERLHCPETDLQNSSQVKVAQVALVALVAFSFEDQCSELPGEGFKVESSTTFVSNSDR